MRRTFFALTALAVAQTSLPAAESSETFELYVTNERDGTVSVIDGATQKVVSTFPVGKRPRGIRCTADGQSLLVALSGSPRMGPGVDKERELSAAPDRAADGLGVIDRKVRSLRTKLNVGSDPEQFGLSLDGALAVIANEDKGTASIVSVADGKVLAEALVGEEPEGVAVNPANGQFYVTCETAGDVFVIDPEKGQSIAKFNVGPRPRSAAFLPDGSRAYVPSETDGTIAIIDTSTNKVTGKILLQKPALPMDTLMSPNGKELYVSNGRGNTVSVIDTAMNREVATIPVGKRAWGLALSPDGKRLFSANGISNDISVIDLPTRKEVARIPVGDGPWGIAVGR